jgi:hypothetical protein
MVSFPLVFPPLPQWLQKEISSTLTMLEADGSFCAHGERRIEDLGARLINPDKLVEFALFPRREVQPMV